jgi:MFS family permease
VGLHEIREHRLPSAIEVAPLIRIRQRRNGWGRGGATVADRLGRRPIFTFALVLYAIATVVMGLQNSAFAIDLCRFVASMGVGLELVAIDCYLAELMPKAVRGRAFAVGALWRCLS